MHVLLLVPLHAAFLPPECGISSTASSSRHWHQWFRFFNIWVQIHVSYPKMSRFVGETLLFRGTFLTSFILFYLINWPITFFSKQASKQHDLRTRNILYITTWQTFRMNIPHKKWQNKMANTRHEQIPWLFHGSENPEWVLTLHIECTHGVVP